MSTPERPDPDALLAAIKRDEERSRKGKLFLFFGMAPGVGKTYAMLEAARQLKREGIDLVVGIVETHGREETQALLEGLEVIPRKNTLHRNANLQEMDIDAVLARKPRVVLVDELAHTNIPGSRHPKRYQDVFELLDAGIDVLSTLNVQHIESRKDAVEQIANISVRETVPDTILDRAYQIRLIDLSPDDLLKRLKEGKVYLGDKAELAAANFFKDDKLTALREMALRLTAEKVDYELQSLRASREGSVSWRATERLMVAVSHSPYSERLIRATRRFAFNLEAPWVAANVNTGVSLNDDDEITLQKNINLARELGAEVVVTTDTNVLAALTRIAQQKNVTQIVMGRPTKRWVKDFIEGGTLLDQLVRESGDIDIHVLRQDTPSRPNRYFFSSFQDSSPLSSYILSLWFVGGASALSALLINFIGYRAVGFVFLLSVLLLGFIQSLGPVLFASVLTAIIWDYFFIPPVGTFVIREPEDVFMCLAYLLVALITGTLTRRIRRHETLIRNREERIGTLYEIVRDIASSSDRKTMKVAVTSRLNNLLGGRCAVALRLPSGKLDELPLSELGWVGNEKETAVAEWAFSHNRHAGWSTDTLPAAEALYIPLKGTSEVIGILAYRPLKRTGTSRENENLLFTAARQLAISLERELFREKAIEAIRLEESEKLHQTILNSVSHEIRTPLTAIIGMASALTDKKVGSDLEMRTKLTQELVDAGERLNHVVENLLDMSRLSSGVLALKLDWHDLRDVVSIAIETLKKTLSRHKIIVKENDMLPLVRIDFRLFEQSLANLLINAATYSPPGTEILIQASHENESVCLRVSDQGKGIPEEALPHIFEKFYRVPGSKPGGTGLGLTIAKSIVEAHGGTISVKNQIPNGAEFTISLPVENQPHGPTEKPQ